MRQCLALLLLVFALPAAAQIYRYTDASGSTAYSNQPPNGTKAETVELPPLNSVETQRLQAPPPLPPMDGSPPVSAEPKAAYSTLELTDLPQDEALRANNGTFTVGVAIKPRLAPGHLLQLLVDGNPYGQPGNVPRLQVVSIERGEHSFAVVVLDQGRVVQQSPTIALTVQRVHVGKP